jgi:hypothetical protein
VHRLGWVSVVCALSGPVAACGGSPRSDAAVSDGPADLPSAGDRGDGQVESPPPSGDAAADHAAERPASTPCLSEAAGDPFAVAIADLPLGRTSPPIVMAGSGDLPVSVSQVTTAVTVDGEPLDRCGGAEFVLPRHLLQQPGSLDLVTNQNGVCSHYTVTVEPPEAGDALPEVTSISPDSVVLGANDPAVEPAATVTLHGEHFLNYVQVGPTMNTPTATRILSANGSCLRGVSRTFVDSGTMALALSHDLIDFADTYEALAVSQIYKVKTDPNDPTSRHVAGPWVGASNRVAFVVRGQNPSAAIATVSPTKVDVAGWETLTVTARDHFTARTQILATPAGGGPYSPIWGCRSYSKICEFRLPPEVANGEGLIALMALTPGVDQSEPWQIQVTYPIPVLLPPAESGDTLTIEPFVPQIVSLGHPRVLPPPQGEVLETTTGTTLQLGHGGWIVPIQLLTHARTLTFQAVNGRAASNKVDIPVQVGPWLESIEPNTLNALALPPDVVFTLRGIALATPPSPGGTAQAVLTNGPPECEARMVPTSITETEWKVFLPASVVEDITRRCLAIGPYKIAAEISGAPTPNGVPLTFTFDQP